MFGNRKGESNSDDLWIFIVIICIFVTCFFDDNPKPKTLKIITPLEKVQNFIIDNLTLKNTEISCKAYVIDGYFPCSIKGIDTNDETKIIDIKCPVKGEKCIPIKSEDVKLKMMENLKDEKLGPYKENDFLWLNNLLYSTRM